MLTRLSTMILALTMALPVAAADPPDDVARALARWNRHHQEATVKRASMARALQRPPAASKSWDPQLGPSSIDVSNYSIALSLDFDRHVASGTVEATMTVMADDLDAVRFDAWSGLRILSVTLIDDPSLVFDPPTGLSFIHRHDVLSIDLPHTFERGQEIRLLISYGGRAGSSGDGINWDTHGAGRQVAWTMAEPFGARVWWPCNDRPDDKAVVDLEVTAPSLYTVASNGVMEGRVENADGTATTRWASAYPVSTYLVVMNVAEYTRSEQTYETEGGQSMPVVLYAFPEIAEQAEEDLAVTKDMIAVLAESFGEYPFLDEKYGNCTANFGGGMEHQTLTTIAAAAVGDPWMPWLDVHELGHQWWGDWLTCENWRDLWLNEGFATLTEWLWAEHQGSATLQDYLADSDSLGLFLGPVFDNPVPFSTTVYDKGAWVLRMLRNLVGDEDFFAALATYRTAHAGGPASTEDLRAAFESVTGRDLEPFWEQWVYGKNRPRFLYHWENTAGPTLSFTIDQVQTNAHLFAMPLDLRVTTTAGTEDHRVDVQATSSQTFTIPLAAEATRIELDPDRWNLFLAARSDQPMLDLGPLAPGPIPFGFASATTSTTGTIPLTNVGGAPLTISAIGFAYGANDFSLSSPPSMPLTIDPGETYDLEITYRSGGLGTQTNWLWLWSNDPNSEGYTYAQLQGTGTLFPGTVLQMPSSVSLGEVPVNGAATTTIEISNLGSTDVALSGGVEGEAFSLMSEIPAVATAGSRNRLLVRFEPTLAGRSQGKLTIDTDNPSSPTVEITLTGDGAAAPHLSVTPAAALGPVGSLAGTTVSLVNDGTEPLVISEARIEGLFELVSDLSLPVELETGERLDVAVKSTADEPGETEGRLRILSNDPVLPWATIPLFAIGESEPVQPSDGPGQPNSVGPTRGTGSAIGGAP